MDVRGGLIEVVCESVCSRVRERVREFSEMKEEKEREGVTGFREGNKEWGSHVAPSQSLTKMNTINVNLILSSYPTRYFN